MTSESALGTVSGELALAPEEKDGVTTSPVGENSGILPGLAHIPDRLSRSTCPELPGLGSKPLTSSCTAAEGPKPPREGPWPPRGRQVAATGPLTPMCQNSPQTALPFHPHPFPSPHSPSVLVQTLSPLNCTWQGTVTDSRCSPCCLTFPVIQGGPQLGLNS